MPNVWRLMAHHEEAHRPAVIDWAMVNGRIAIGWGEVDCLAQYAAPGNIVGAARNVYGNNPNPPANLPLCGIQLWNFRGGAHPFYPNPNDGPHAQRQAMQCGDLVILKGNGFPTQGTPNRSVVMRVSGPYEYIAIHPGNNPPFNDYQHQRRAQVENNINAEQLWQQVGRRDGVHALGQNNRSYALVLCQFPVPQ